MASDLSDDDIFLTQSKLYQPEVDDISDTDTQCDINDDKRFKEPVNDEQITDASRKRFATSTEKKCRWASKLFAAWKSSRNRKAIREPKADMSVIRCELEEMTKDELNYSISRFIMEVKKTNGEDFPGKTLYELVVSLQLYLEMQNKQFKFLDDLAFVQIRNTLDTLMKERASVGLGLVVKKAKVITDEEEHTLWSRDLLGSDTPRKLMETLLYLIGVNFALRAVKEHRSLRWNNSQLSLHVDDDGKRLLRYSEDVSKSRQGGIKHKNVKGKVVDAYENVDNREKCIVTLFEKYNLLCPPMDIRPDAFYLKPLVKPKELWYSCQPVGINSLRKVVQNLCKEGGFDGFRSNHSLRATAATRLYKRKFNENVICETTGHRSLAVREYERTDSAMKRDVSSALQLRDDKIPSCATSGKYLKVEVPGIQDLNNSPSRIYNININIK